MYGYDYVRVTQFGYGGIRLISSVMVGDPYEDWSGVRSRGRAERRRKQGHAQRIVTRYRANGSIMHDKINNVMYVHPHDRAKVEAALTPRN